MRTARSVPRARIARIGRLAEGGRSSLFALSLLASAATAACGTTSSTGGLADLAVASRANLADPPKVLISHDYTLAAGQEVYLCKRVTLTADWALRSLIPSSAPGTHHELLGIDPKKARPDGVADCGGTVEFDVAGWQMLYASGVASPPLVMPDGVSIRLKAGDRIVLQMHLLNASTSSVNGTATLSVTTWPAGTTLDAAQMILAGPVPDSRLTPSIPVGPGHVVSGTCTLPSATRYFAVFPHMHQVGTHIQVQTVGGQTNMLYDHDYQFSNQEFAQFAPVPLAAGDQIKVACTYDNETGKPVKFGQSSLEEMCFAISFFSPPLPTKAFGDFCFQ